MTQEPFKEGITSGSEVDMSTAEVRRKQLSQATRLSDLQKEFAIFTPAMVYLHVPLKGDFLSAYQAQNGAVETFSVELDKPVFNGLNVPNGDKRWNHVLYGMPLEHWDHFYSWVGTLAVMDRDSGVLYRVRTQEINIVDPFLFNNAVVLPDKLPVEEITTLCVETNVGCYYYLSSKGLEPAKAVFDKDLIYEDTKRFAEAYQAGVNPYQSEEGE